MLKTVCAAWAPSVRLLGAALRERQNAYCSLQDRVMDYEEYVEAWVHEAKMPLSLLPLLLDNRREELPGQVAYKLDYIRNRLQEFVDQMLFYARLKGARKDYLFEYVNVGECIREVLEDYYPLLEEKKFQVAFPEELAAELVYTDRRGLRFLLQQAVSNSVKYCRREPRLCFEMVKREKSRILKIRDNGPGTPACDMPYLFEKGFTGESGQDRKKATGMGLYLAKEMARDLGLTLEAESRLGEGFQIAVAFPVVEDSFVEQPESISKVSLNNMEKMV